MRDFKNQFCPIFIDYSREKGLVEVVVLLCEAMEAKIEQLEGEKSEMEEEKSQLEEKKSRLETEKSQFQEEKKSQLSKSLLEKIPECSVNSHLRSQLQTNYFNAFFLRSVLSSSRRTGPSTAVWPDITSVDPASLRRPSR